jgi:hypothetical protein
MEGSCGCLSDLTGTGAKTYYLQDHSAKSYDQYANPHGPSANPYKYIMERARHTPLLPILKLRLALIPHRHLTGHNDLNPACSRILKEPQKVLKVCHFHSPTVKEP